MCVRNTGTAHSCILTPACENPLHEDNYDSRSAQGGGRNPPKRADLVFIVEKCLLHHLERLSRLCIGRGQAVQGEGGLAKNGG